MNHGRKILASIAVMMATAISGCGEGHGEHDRDGHGHHGEEGEESGTELALSESYDQVRNGVRLMITPQPLRRPR